VAIFEGQLHIDKADRFALVTARFNEFIVDRLVEGAMDCLLRHGGGESQVDIFRVPGSFELPQVALEVARTGKYAGVALIGAVIRGGTPHFDMIAAEVTKGAAQVALETGVPLVFGVRVPGSFELPQVALEVARTGKYAGVALIGAVIRGGTPHFDMIAAEVTKGAAQVALETGVPLVFGVLTTDTVEQAIERAGTKMGNKGWEAAQSLIEMVNLRRAMKHKKGK